MGLRILQVITDNDRRGAQLFAAHLGDALVDRGHLVETVALVDGDVGGLGFPPLGSRWPSVRVLRTLRRHMADVDVTVAHGSDTGLACALATARHRPYVYRQISDSAFWTPTRAKRARARFGMNRGRAVVALSEFNRAQLVDVIGVRPEKIVVVPNAVPGAAFTPASPAERAAARTDLGLAGDAAVVLSAGALTPEKGTDVALEAVAGLEGVHLIVAGAGPERARLEALASARAPGRVHFLGSRADLVSLYHAADVLVLASRGGDSMPAVLLEAALCGLPAVSTRIGAIPEVIVDGITGIVVAPDDVAGLGAGLQRLLDDPGEQRRMGDAARHRARERYELRPVAAAWESVLTRIAGRG